MVAQMQRRELAALGERLSAPVVFLKAVWADEVLYGGAGNRIGNDIDILVPNSHFRLFARGLEGQGYHKVVASTHPMTSEYGDKEWLFTKPGAALPIDLHRSLSDHFPDATPHFLARRKTYQTKGGGIVSLDEGDQVLYCVIHYMGHGFVLNDRHLQDIVRLSQGAPLDWEAIRSRAAALKMQVPMALLADALAKLGAMCPEPTFFLQTPRLLRRYRWAQKWVGTSKGFSRLSSNRSKLQLYIDLLYRFPRLGGRPSAGVTFLPRYFALRLADQVALASARGGGRGS